MASHTESTGGLVEARFAFARSVRLEVGVRSAFGTAGRESVSTGQTGVVARVAVTGQSVLVVALVALTHVGDSRESVCLTRGARCRQTGSTGAASWVARQALVVAKVVAVIAAASSAAQGSCRDTRKTSV